MARKTGFKPMVVHADFIMQAVRLISHKHGHAEGVADLQRTFPSMQREHAIGLLDGSLVLTGNTEDGFEVNEAEEDSDNG